MKTVAGSGSIVQSPLAMSAGKAAQAESVSVTGRLLLQWSLFWQPVEHWRLLICEFQP
jgi:hypothetical protein